MLRVKANIITRSGGRLSKEFDLEFWHQAMAVMFFRYYKSPYLDVAHATFHFSSDGTEELPPVTDRRYEYKHILGQSIFDHSINDVVFSPDPTQWGKEGWRVIKILPTGKDGAFDIFLEREIIQDGSV